MNVADCPVKSTVRTIFHYVVGSCSTALLMGAGDVLIQYFNGVPELRKIDWQRTAKFSSIGFCFTGPVLTYWSSIVKSVVGVGKSHVLLATLKQLVCDQIFLAPSLNLGVVTLAGVMNYESMFEIEKRIAEDFPYIIKRHYMLWPAVQFFGKMCIQPSLQLLFANSIAIIWFALISAILHKDKVMTRTMESDKTI